MTSIYVASREEADMNFALLWIGSAVLPNFSALRCICVIGLRLVRPSEANQVNLVNNVSSTEVLARKMNFETFWRKIADGLFAHRLEVRNKVINQMRPYQVWLLCGHDVNQ